LAELPRDELLAETGWSRDAIDRTLCHQVGMAHRKGMLDRLGLSPERDFATVQWLGNTGACALPSALGIAAHLGALPTDSRLAMLGIGSGINCAMAAVHWRGIAVGGEPQLHDWIPASANATWHLVPSTAGQKSG
jgi:3-oxoacyl-[acyl-carrier-protein] synthase-3